MRICAMVSAIALVVLMMAIKVVAKQPRETGVAVIEAVAPAYPPIAATAGAAGTVTIEVRIKTDGTVSSARVILGVGVLAAAAKKSARRWVFAAAERQRSTRVVRLTFVFKIMPPNTTKDELLPIFMPPYRVEVRAIVPEGIDSVSRDLVRSRPRGYKPLKEPHSLLKAVTKRVDPRYPSVARSVRAEGQVVVRILVNKKGDVVKACVIEGHPLLQGTFLVAAKQWKFAKNFGFVYSEQYFLVHGE